MVQKKLPLINSSHGSETRNIINEIIKAINDRGLEILSESAFLNWLDGNGVKHQGEWDDAKGYDRLSVVLHEGNSYTSVKIVPVGIDILNKEFWVLTGNYNAQVDYYREETERVAEDLLLKSDQTYVDTELDKKANQTDVDVIDDLLSDVSINVKSFGATGDGVTDDTQAIQDAIDSLVNGGVLLFPVGNYLISGSDSHCLEVTKPIKFLGSGAFSRLLVKRTVPINVDVIAIRPTMNIGGELYGFENLEILPENFYDLTEQGGFDTRIPGRHTIHLDCTNTRQYISKLLINNNVFRGFNGYGIYLTNPVGMDAFFTSTIMNNLIHNGMWLDRCGDSINIIGNTFTEKHNLFIHPVSGASTNIIAFNNFTTSSGAIEIGGGMQIKILYNQIEQKFNYTGTSNAIVAVGTKGYIELVEIVGNNINSWGDKIDNNIKIDNAYRTVIDNNHFFKGKGKPIIITNKATRTIIGQNNMFEEIIYDDQGGIVTGVENSIEDSVTDNGSGTIGIPKKIALNLSWKTDPTFDNPLTAEKDDNGYVNLKGTISTDIPSDYESGTLLFTLPISFRPLKGTRFMCYNGSEVPAVININSSSGDVRLISGNGNMLTLDNTSFKAN